MIIFYDKRNGRIFSTIDGRVHDPKTINNSISDSSVPEEFVGKKIIGWEETEEVEKYEEVQQLEMVKPEEFEKLPKNERKKVVSEGFATSEKGEEFVVNEIDFYKINRIKVPVFKQKEHNLHNMPVLERFEDNTPFSPCTHCKIDLETEEFIEVEPPKPTLGLEEIRKIQIERLKIRKEKLQNKEVSSQKVVDPLI